MHLLFRAAAPPLRFLGRYSNPSLYAAAKHAEGTAWTVKTDDFFPYGDSDHAYWYRRNARERSVCLGGGALSAPSPKSISSRRARHHRTGYFSSRPLLKRYERVTSGWLQARRVASVCCVFFSFFSPYRALDQRL